VDEILRKLARDQWVRLHGTPRVTVLAGGARARQLWHDWLAVSATAGTLLDGDFARDIRAAVTRAAAEPAHPIAVIATARAIARWRAAHHDRVAAMVDEGWIEVTTRDAARPRPRPRSPARLDARSVAEATLFEALEATRATAGRFRLNEPLSVRFGSVAAEVDLLSRGDRIAIEIDGIHHFADPECYRRDRRKDLLMQTQGLIVIRVLAEDVLRDVRAAVNVVCEALAYRLEER
jgi:very-short-patch-repair endonuclease